MGVFWDTQPNEVSYHLVASIEDALTTAAPSDSTQLHKMAVQKAKAIQTTPPVSFHPTRLVIAMFIVAILVGAGIYCDAHSYADATKYVFGIATTAFGIVVGLLTGKS